MATELTGVFFSFSSLYSAPRSYPKPLIILVALCCAESIRGISADYNIQSMISTTHSNDFYHRIVMFCVVTPFLITLNTIYFFLTACENWVVFTKAPLSEHWIFFAYFILMHYFPFLKIRFYFIPHSLSFARSFYNSDSSQQWNQVRFVSALDYYQFFSVITEIFLKYHHSRSTWLKLTILTIT